MAEEKQLPEGFRFANKLPAGEQKWEALPPEAYERKRPSRKPEAGPKVSCLREALDLFKMRYPSMTKEKDVNFEGARIGAVYRNTTTSDRYLVLFKREFYLKFGEHFPQVKEKGYGLLCAKKIVAWAADEGLRIASVFPDGRCYYLSAMDFWLYYEENGTDCPRAEGEIATPLKLWRKIGE